MEVEPRISDYIASPQSTPLKRLVELTRHYYFMSSVTDNPRSSFHRFYYCLANECERRGYSLDRILRYTKEG